MDPGVWGPKYWSVLMTIAQSYPDAPNEIIKQKYYQFFQNLPVFLPFGDFANRFAGILDEYPVQPYLDCSKDLSFWVYLVHNRVNRHLGKEEISFTKAMENYQAEYQPKEIRVSQKLHCNKNIILGVLLVFLIWMLYVYEFLSPPASIVTSLVEEKLGFLLGKN